MQILRYAQDDIGYGTNSGDGMPEHLSLWCCVGVDREVHATAGQEAGATIL
jgi:hypothetical protein